MRQVLSKEIVGSRMLPRFLSSGSRDNNNRADNTPNSNGPRAGENFLSDDPVVLLRQIQAKMKSGKERERHDPGFSGKKPLFFEKKSETQPKEKPNRVFMEKLSSMEEEWKQSTFSAFSSAREERQKKKEDKIEQERSKLLVFRDVGMDLDKPVLSRDIFLIFKYFLLGKEFAIDNELERMLRYFNEHAINELKIIHNSKLMRGMESLLPIRHVDGRSSLAAGSGSSAHGGVPSTLLFPTVRCANAAQFCPNPSPTLAGDVTKLLFRTPCAWSAFVQPRHAESVPAYHPKREEFFITMDAHSFQRPAVVIFSQLGQKFGAEADMSWRRAAYRTICPSVDVTLGGEQQQQLNKTTLSFNTSSSSQKKTSLPIDVISLRSSDLYQYKWVQKLYVSRFISSLSRMEESFGNHLLASTTFVGSGLLQPFFHSLGLRNYLSPYVFLVDAQGRVRWMSSGLPDAWETDIFPCLLHQLVKEYTPQHHK